MGAEQKVYNISYFSYIAFHPFIFIIVQVQSPWVVWRDQQFVYYHAGGKWGSRPVLTRANAKDTFESIPIMNVAAIFSNLFKKHKKVAIEIGRASQEVGFFDT